MARSTERNAALHLIGRIYDGALDAKHLPDIVKEVVHFIQGTKGVLFTAFHRMKVGGFYFPYRLSQSALEQRDQHYDQHDIWAQTMATKGLDREGMVILDTDLIPEKELLASIMYREFFAPQDISKVCGGIIFGKDSKGMLPAVLSVFRSVRDRPFGESERGRMKMLVPHLSRALGVMYRLRKADLMSAAALQSLDRLTVGVLLLDSRGRVMHMNRSARRALETRDGLVYRRGATGAPAVSLMADDRQAASGIQAAIALCLTPDALEVPHFSHGVSVPRPSGAASYVLNFAPLPLTKEFVVEGEAARAIVFLSDPDEPAQVDPALLKKLYSLTSAESKVAIELSCGSTVASAAQNMGLKQTTVRTHLRSIFAKTGTSRQAELVKLLASLSATDVS